MPKRWSADPDGDAAALAEVAVAAEQHTAATHAWCDAIVTAAARGITLRRIAEVAGVSHDTVARLVNAAGIVRPWAN